MSEALRIAIDIGPASAMLEKSPEVVIRHVGGKLARGAQEVARHERDIESPKAFSNLANSIRSIQVGPLHYRVAPGVRYAVHVHEGTGPGGVPPAGAIEDWIRLKRITPHTPGVEPEDLPFLIRRSIAKKGIKADPFAARTKEKMTPRVLELANQGVQDAIKELTGGAA